MIVIIAHNKLTMAASVGFREFLRRAREVHGDLYDYSGSEAQFTTYKEGKIPIVCSQHGVFNQTPYHHVYRKQGCPECAGNAKVSFEEFLRRAREAHKGKYEYSDSESYYVNYKEGKIPIDCGKHGRFWKRPYHHATRGQGCPFCQIESASPENSLSTVPYISTKKLISMDESNNLEFKSSVWQGYDGETGEIGNTEFPNRTVEDGVLKTVCAFLNSDGGTLVIGVRDRPEKSVIGIEEDFKFCGERKDGESFQNKLSELFSNRFCSETIVGTRVHLSTEKIGRKMVCRVDVMADPSGWPVMTNKEKKFEFYVRQGPKTVLLVGRDVFAWVRE